MRLLSLFLLALSPVEAFVSHVRRFRFSGAWQLQRLVAFGRNPFRNSPVQLLGSTDSEAPVDFATSPRVQRIKDLSDTQEILNVLTSCEFATRLEVGRSKANIDFPDLFRRIDRGIDTLELRRDRHQGNFFSKADLHCKTDQDEDEVLWQRIFAAKQELQQCMEECELSIIDQLEEEAVQQSLNQTFADSDQVPKPNFIVREDGVMDWDETIASSRDLVSADMKERLFGRDEEEEKAKTKNKTKDEDVNAEVKRLQDFERKAWRALEQWLEKAEESRRAVRQAKASGQAISNEDLAALKITDDNVAGLSKLVTLCKLNLDIEQKCAHLEQLLLDSNAYALDLKMVVAEVNLIERQLTGVMGRFDMQQLEAALDNSTDFQLSPRLLQVDEGELALLRFMVNDLQKRLGIGAAETGATGWALAGKVLKDLGSRIRESLIFFKGGMQILFADIRYTVRLIWKRFRTGYKFNSREANAVRRTVKDILALVPSGIIMVVPLTPVGTVMLFSFIQRYCPGFFPSCFTDNRHNLRQLYSDVLVVNRKDVMQKLSLPRVSEFWKLFREQTLGGSKPWFGDSPEDIKEPAQT